MQKLLASFSLRQRIAIVMAAVVAGAGLYALVQWRQEADFRPLYTGLAPEDAGGIVQKLKESGVEYRLGEGGASVLAPSTRIASGAGPLPWEWSGVIGRRPAPVTPRGFTSIGPVRGSIRPWVAEELPDRSEELLGLFEDRHVTAPREHPQVRGLDPVRHLDRRSEEVAVPTRDDDRDLDLDQYSRPS